MDVIKSDNLPHSLESRPGTDTVETFPQKQQPMEGFPGLS